MKKKHVRSKKGVMLLLFLISFHMITFAQTVNVTGNVSDDNGESLPGVNITVVGTFQGTITNIDGIYSIDVPADGQLKFNFIGFASQIVDVNNQSKINIVLSEDSESLDEVVVVGYGVQKKSDITGAITSVDVDRLGDVPASSISRALQGKTAGVEIQSTSNRPGGETQIRIRGSRSLTASNDPLIVVDGIPYGGSLSDISSDNIESMEILKDASATVIYGSRGANGVIIITTKRGKVGELKISYNGYYGVSTVARKYDVYNAEEFVNLRTAANYTNYLPNEKESMLLGRETDWQDLVYENGFTVNHEVTLSGGTETTQYAITGGYFKETGVLPEMQFGRYNLRIAIDQAIGDYVKVGLTTMNSYAKTDGESANPMWALVSLTPLSIPYNQDGTINERPGYDTDETHNPLLLSDRERWVEERVRKSSFNTLYGEVKILDGLKYKLNIGLELTNTEYNNYYASNTPFKDGKTNTAQVKNSDNLSYTIENIVTYDKTFNEDHRISVTGLYSIQESESTSSRFDASNVPVDYLQYHNMSLAETVVAPGDDNFYSKWGLISYMGRINYAYKDRYLLTLSGRMDGSSRLAKGNKWHSYPAVALGWNVINESFMENIDVVSNLKVRVGYGETSNTSIDPYRTLGGLSATHYSFDDAGVKGYYVSSLPNKNLGWEYTKTINFGLDFGLFRGRLSGNVDFYMQETSDLLLGKSLPPSQGVPGSFLENVGKTENKGLEVVLNGIIYNPQKDGDFSWDVSANLFFNREEIVSLQDPSVKKDVGNGWFVGHPSSSIYDYEKLGIWQLGEETEAAVFGKKPGDIKLKDLNGDGEITDEDRRVLGSSQPDFQGGFSSYWAYKGFDFSIVGYFRVGGLLRSTLHMPNIYVNRLDGRHNGIKVDYWTPENPTNDMPAPDVTIDASRSEVLGYFDASFLKIRSINLGYNISKKHTKFLGNNASVRVYGSVSDPFIFFSPYVDKGGIDPEPNGRGEDEMDTINIPKNALTIGLNTPPTRKFIFGLNVKF
ncbi:MAG: SusC/RagA family TonB-linked outer membrane protein [Bacteroidales bacterium]|nr:MAG: SusC/RagA family TonB-linked outer membrane protein [Bacteroidales bacterium]